MLKFSTNNIEFNKEQAFGFDLDGTLYDEFEFICHAYRTVADYIASFSGNIEQYNLWNYMINCWLEEGSAKTDLFQAAFTYASVYPNSDRIKECIRLYREAPFQLTLSTRAKFILDLCKKESKIMFIVTDGNSVLQRRKIDALGLKEWFDEEFIFISGDYGKEYQKPGVGMVQHISKVVDLELGNICYLGDRDVDEKFAVSTGFDFYYAPCMQIMSRTMRKTK